MLGADRLDGGQVLLVVLAHAEPEVAQLTGHLDVAALAQGSQAVDGPVAIALEVTHQADDHAAILPGGIASSGGRRAVARSGRVDRVTDQHSRPTGRRRYSTKWSVIAFVVLGMVISLAVILWRLRGD